jgi:hypothetical protein
MFPDLGQEEHCNRFQERKTVYTFKILELLK